MRKVLIIAAHDLVTTFRHPVALIFMLALPFALTLIMAAAFGGSSGLGPIAVVVVNHDEGTLGKALVEMLQSEGLADLLQTTVVEDEASARARVDADKAAAAIIIPAGFSTAVMGPGRSTPTEVEVYANPSRPISVSVVRGIVSSFVDSVNVGVVGGQVVFATLARAGALSTEPSAWEKLGKAWGEHMAAIARDRRPDQQVRLVPLGGGEEEASTFDVVAFLAPSMALFTLMFTMTAGGRVLLEERTRGTLQRLLSTPTRPMQVLIGKIVGIWWTGWAQLAILLTSTALLFHLSWGNPLAVVLVCVVVVLAASGWGVVIAAFSRTTAQANAIGTAVSLVFGMTAGHFFPRENLPRWLAQASRISPNAWGLDAFRILLEGGTLSDLVPILMALVAMTVVLYGVAAIGLRRQLSE